MSTRRRSRSRRRGFSYLEVQAAFAVLGIALAGLAPIVMTQLRLMARIERRLPSNRIIYLVPPDDSWAAKLGAAARRSLDFPSGVAAAEETAAVYSVSVESVASSAADDSATVVVTLTPIEAAPPP